MSSEFEKVILKKSFLGLPVGTEFKCIDNNNYWYRTAPMQPNGRTAPNIGFARYVIDDNPEYFEVPGVISEADVSTNYEELLDKVNDIIRFINSKEIDK